VRVGGKKRDTAAVIMGLTFTKLFSRLFSKKEMRILMVRVWGGFGRGGPTWSDVFVGVCLFVCLFVQWVVDGCDV